MENESNLLNEKELEQVIGGLGGSDPVEPGSFDTLPGALVQV